MTSYFEKKAKKAQQREHLPDWVNKENASYRAYLCINQLKEEKLSFINNNPRKSNYKTKKAYQISGAEVARKINVANATLLCTSSYSTAVNTYLEQVNQELLKAKENRLKKTEAIRSRGPIAKPKDELAAEVTTLKKRLKVLEEQNVKEQVSEIFNQLDLNIKVRLHINSGRT